MNFFKKIFQKTLIFTCLCCSNFCIAHYLEVNTNIKNETFVDEIPKEFEIGFLGDYRLLSLQWRDITKDYQSQWIKIRFGRSLKFKSNYSIKLPELPKGILQIQFKMMDQEGHVDGIEIEFINQ